MNITDLIVMLFGFGSTVTIAGALMLPSIIASYGDNILVPRLKHEDEFLALRAENIAVSKENYDLRRERLTGSTREG